MRALVLRLKGEFAWWLLGDYPREIVVGDVKPHSGVKFCDWGACCFRDAIPACKTCIHGSAYTEGTT